MRRSSAPTSSTTSSPVSETSLAAVPPRPKRKPGRAREMALQEMEDATRLLGTNAVVGIDFDYEVVGQGGSMLMECATGTAG